MPVVIINCNYINDHIIATVLSNRHHKRWSLHQTVFWILGTVCVTIAVVGPLAHRAHIDFTVHMLGHLLLGMLVPIFMVLAAPTTLFLRTLNVKTARRLDHYNYLVTQLSQPYLI